MSAGAIVGLVFGCLFVISIITLLVIMPRKAYFTALFSGCYISLFKLIGMKLRGRNVLEIVGAYILSKKSQLGISLYDLEVVSISGGHPCKIVEGIISSNAAGLKFDFNFVKAIDISGKDVLEVVRECINHKVIELPLINSMAQDKQEINAKISLTLKVNAKNFLKGVTDETISARAVEAVVTKIANTTRASELISRPELLDKTIFDAGVDEDSKYELVSADVIHVDYGVNRALSQEKEVLERQHMQNNHALEQRRLAALAQEQEVKVKAEEARLKVLEEELEIPRTIKKAIEDGKIKDVMDYYKLENLRADTDMRRHLSGANNEKKKNNPFDDLDDD